MGDTVAGIVKQKNGSNGRRHVLFGHTMATVIKRQALFQSGTGGALGRITMAGIIYESEGVRTDPMRLLGSYAIVYLLGGAGWYADASGRRDAVVPGDMLFLFPDVAHGYGPARGEHWDEIHIVFEGPVFDLWRARGVLTAEEPVYHLEPIAHWRRRIEEVIAPGLSPLERVCRLQMVLGDALTNYQRDPAAALDEEWLGRARAILDERIGEGLYVEGVARRLGLSPETFRKRFARLAGMPPWRYRITRVIEQACRLVHESRLTNKEIAAQLGFNDEFHFSRRFKQITGRSPTQFRALSARR